MNQPHQVFVYPKQLEFYLDDGNSHKSIANLYNSHDFPIKYKVLTTAPKKYTVTDPEGIIPPKSTFNLIIKHTTSAFRSENTIDKLRIQIYELNGATAIGKKDITLYSIVSRDNHIAAVMSKMKSQLNSAESPDETTTSKYSMSSFSYGNNLNDMMTHLDKHHSQAQLSPSQSSHLKKLKLNQKSPSSSTLLNAQSTESVNYLVILIGVVCLGILFLPLTGTSDSYLPTYMYVTHEIKLISTFILGMVTMVILKT